MVRHHSWQAGTASGFVLDWIEDWFDVQTR